jgi:hypothetical protein
MRLVRILPFFFAMPSLSHGAVETFVETFDADGPYQSLNNDLIGFDNPGWDVYSDDAFENGGFHIVGRETHRKWTPSPNGPLKKYPFG